MSDYSEEKHFPSHKIVTIAAFYTQVIQDAGGAKYHNIVDDKLA